MAKRRMGIILFLLCFCVCMMPVRAQAISTADAKEPISLNEACSLTITYASDGMALSGQSVQLYQVADISDTLQYNLTPAFAASGLALNGIQSNSEWNVIRSTLDSYILASAVAPTQTSQTDEAGHVSFAQLKPGLYLTSSIHAVQDGLSYQFDSALVALPGLSEDCLWQYQIAMAAKPKIAPPAESKEFKVVKLWKGENDSASRPQSVEIEIFRNGISYETVILSAENNWAYSWSITDDNAQWNVVERNIPTGYTMTLSETETTFVLTNTWVPEGSDPPKPPPMTGDTTNILLYAVLMYVSGTMLIILAFAGKRKRHDQTT